MSSLSDRLARRRQTPESSSLAQPTTTALAELSPTHQRLQTFFGLMVDRLPATNGMTLVAHKLIAQGVKDLRKLDEETLATVLDYMITSLHVVRYGEADMETVALPPLAIADKDTSESS